MGNFICDPRKGRKVSWGEKGEVLSLAVILAILLRIFLCEPYDISSQSMSPALKPDDKILVNKLAYRFGEPNRGDIIVFQFPLDEKESYIKRIIGLPGEIIEGKENKITINDQLLKEDYLPRNLEFDNFGPYQVGAGEFYVLGDQRDDSEDSRYWGPLAKTKIKGKAIIIYWPMQRLAWLS